SRGEIRSHGTRTSGAVRGEHKRTPGDTVLGPIRGRGDYVLMDISDSLAANSNQQNYDEYLAGPKTVTVSEVKKGSAEQPVEVHLVEFPGKPFKPAKTVRRLLAKVWG